MRYCTALVLLVLTALAWPCAAATIRVAQDGSGDFTVIADGVLAAASGDTVTIGPGVYTETRIFDTPGGPAEYVARVTTPELTIIGDGRDTVIVGPQSPASNLELGPTGIVTAVGANARVRGIAFRNLSAGVNGVGTWIEVDDCRFDRNYRGVSSLLSGFATIRNSEFMHNENRGIMAFEANGGTGALVEGCTFTDNVRTGIDFQPLNCEVRNSTFEGGTQGVQVSFGGLGRIENCTFENMLFRGIFITGGSQGYVYDCMFGSNMGVNILVGGLLVGSGNELLGASNASVRTTYSAYVEFTNNHILNAGGWSVEATNGGSPPIRTQDFTNNYWGTTDIAQIEEWIHDLNDEPVVNYIQVDYLPIADQPIPTESTSFGELKARYGGGE